MTFVVSCDICRGKVVTFIVGCDICRGKVVTFVKKNQYNEQIQGLKK